MKKFDLVFERAIYALNEKEYVESTFEDNARALLSMLEDHDLLDKNKTSEQYLKELLAQTENINQITIGVNDSSVPTIQIKLQQDKDNSNSFSATVINLDNPEEQVTFENDWLETIFKSVVDKVKSLSLKNIAPEAAVDELPKEENPAETQPGAEQTALPGV